MSKVFDWVIKRVARWVGTNGNALLYFLLAREIFRQAHEREGGDEERALAVTKEIFQAGVMESADRHPGLFRFFPDTPERALKYINVLWQIFFGIEVGPYTKIEDTEPGTGRERHVFRLEQCPFCGGYGSDPEDTVTISSDPGHEGREGFGCIICGMIERVANEHIFTGTGYKIKVTETACMLHGSPYMEVTAVVYTDEDWDREVAPARQGAGGFGMGDRDRASTSTTSSAGSKFDLSELETLLETPLERVRDKLGELVERFARMPPEQVFSYFENYEADFLRVLGFLSTHLLNEYGSVLGRALGIPALARATGLTFVKIRNDYKLFVPPEVVEDNRKVFVELVGGLAPAPMVERFSRLDGWDIVDLFLEGVEQALKDLGVDFSGVDENLWDALRREGQLDRGGREWASAVLDLFEEVSGLATALLSIAPRLVLSSGRAQLKEVVDSRLEVLEVVREHLEKILDTIQEIGGDAA
ncbi:MAG: hypothetical protein ACTSU5_12700 [Promethearchaeota archaeon]